MSTLLDPDTGQVARIQTDPAIVGRACRRPSCGHGEGLHDDEGCVFCRCGYFLQADLLVEIEMLSVVRTHFSAYRGEDRLLYGWLRIFEGWGHERAHAVVHGRQPIKDRRGDLAKRKRKLIEELPGLDTLLGA